MKQATEWGKYVPTTYLVKEYYLEYITNPPNNQQTYTWSNWTRSKTEVTKEDCIYKPLGKCTLKPQWHITTHLSEWLKYEMATASNGDEGCGETWSLVLGGGDVNCTVTPETQFGNILKTKHAPTIWPSDCMSGQFIPEKRRLMFT